LKLTRFNGAATDLSRKADGDITILRDLLRKLQWGRD
jgi:hypothetical protein